MKIVRHTARDMRQAMRGIREQLGEDAVILSSRRTAAGVEVTAAVEFEAATLEAEGFASAPAVPQPAGTAVSSAVVAAPTSAAAVHSATTVVSAATATVLPAAVTVHSAAAITVPAMAAQGAVPVGSALPALAPASPSGAFVVSESAIQAFRISLDEPELISVAAREAVATAQQVAAAATGALPAEEYPPNAIPTVSAPTLSAAPTEVPVFRGDDPVQQACDSALLPFGTIDADDGPGAAPALQAVSSTDAMGHELKTLRRMLETQLAQLAWNDLTRRAPIHTEILRELTEIGITQELAELLIRQLPHDTDLTFARRFAIAGLSQYLRVTGDRWLDHGGRIAFVGSTGVGKTTTLAKVAVRWVLRHGPRDLALISADCVRTGAHDQLQSVAQLLGVPVYTAETLAALPSLVARLNERLILIDTAGASLRDPQLGERLAPLADRSSRIETALVLAASTQAGALEDAVARFEPANPACCVLTKLDEAASLGGALSVLIRARLPVSYLSEGQRVPEDLRPARALELVSSAVQLAKTSGAAADEDLLRRRFGRTAHAFT